MQPATPAKLRTSEIASFESVKFLKKRGIGPV